MRVGPRIIARRYTYLPPIAPALALKVASVLRYQGLVYTVVQAKQG